MPLRGAFCAFLLTALAVSCDREASLPAPDSRERIYTITPADLGNYGRAISIDTLFFQETQEPYYGAALFEFSRGQTPDGFQAEQRAFHYNYLRGFRELSGGGLYPNATTSVREPADSSRFQFTGDPGSGFLLKDSRDGQSIVAQPLLLLRDRQMGLARYRLYAGAGELRREGQRRAITVYFERIYLPAINTFDGPAEGVWHSRASLWLTLPGDAGQIVLKRERNEILRPLFDAGKADAGGNGSDFGALLRSSDGGWQAFPARFEIEPVESGSVGEAAFTGAFQLQGASGAGEDGPGAICKFTVRAVHAVEMYSISRAQSRLAAVRGELECPKTRYPLQGMMRVWPE